MHGNRLDLSQVEVGKLLPPWHLEAIGDSSIPELSDFAGKPLVILFLSLGCPGCLGRAIPYANRLVHESSDRLSVIGISSNYDGVSHSDDQWAAAEREYYLRFSVYRDSNYDTTFLNYGAGGTPHWIIVDSEGLVQYSIFGSEPNNALLRIEYILHNLLQNDNT